MQTILYIIVPLETMLIGIVVDNRSFIDHLPSQSQQLNSLKDLEFFVVAFVQPDKNYPRMIDLLKRIS
jgi:hypothetical protein